MTRLYINSTKPELASRMKPEVYEKILRQREALEGSLAEIIKAGRAITLEIGCGHGHFLTAYGEKHPEEICIGIDVNRGRIFKARKKVERAQLKNVFFLESDSMELLALLPEGTVIAKTWILYPDPWPKKRHFKNRIVQGEFLQQLAEKSAEKAELFIRSDYEPYIDWSKEFIQESPKITLLYRNIWKNIIC